MYTCPCCGSSSNPFDLISYDGMCDCSNYQKAEAAHAAQVLKSACKELMEMGFPTITIRDKISGKSEVARNDFFVVE